MIGKYNEMAAGRRSYLISVQIYQHNYDEKLFPLESLQKYFDDNTPAMQVEDKQHIKTFIYFYLYIYYLL